MPWAELSDVRSYYEWHGRGDPVLLIPGLGGTCRLWDPILPGLARSYCVLIADPRGLGGSEPRRPAEHLHHYAADFVELLDHLQLECVHLAGISWGGVVAQRLAADHPSRVDRLVLISTAHRFTPYLREMSRLIAHTLRRSAWMTFLRALEVLGSSPAYLDRDPEGIERRVRWKAALNVSRAAVGRQLHCMMTCDTPAGLPTVDAPTLVVAGQFDPLIPHCYARDLARTIPDSRFALLEDVGHNPVVECPHRLLDLMVPFLQGDEAAMASTSRAPAGLRRAA